MLRRIYWPQFWYSRFLPAVVQSGPFAGMAYHRRSTGSVVLPKLLGTYESELHPCLESLPLDQYRYCIDVGGGEGYYAVGLCWRFPQLNMLVFEQSGSGRQQIRTLADKNGVSDRIQIRSRCEPAELQNAIKERPLCLLIMDVEGYEQELLEPAQVPALAQTDFIVEIHPERRADLEQLIYSRFEKTHQLTTIRQVRPKEIPPGIQLPDHLQNKAALLTDEFRGPQCWIAGRRILAPSRS